MPKSNPNLHLSDKRKSLLVLNENVRVLRLKIVHTYTSTPFLADLRK